MAGFPTNEKFKEAYKIAQINPRNKIFFNWEENCGCAMTAMYMAETGVNYPTTSRIVNWIERKFGQVNGSSFGCGFDNADMQEYHNKAVFEQGYSLAVELGLIKRYDFGGIV